VSHLANTLEEAVGIYEQLLALRPPGHAQRRQTVSNLGDALYFFCYHHSHDKARADCCISMLREALHLCPPGHLLRDETLHNLARALFFVTFEFLGDQDALAESVVLSREALTLRPPGHPSRDKTLNNLAAALARRFEDCGDYDLLEEAVRMNREALQLCPLGHPRHDMALGYLSVALMTSFEQQGSFETVTEAIALCREAVDLIPTGDPLRFVALSNLAESLRLRFIYQGFSVCLAEAMELYREVLHTMPEAHPRRGWVMTNYGEALLGAFQEHGDSCLLSEAIAALREALTLLPEGFQFHDMALGNLAGALVASSEQSGEMSSLSEAATLRQEALRLRPPGHPRRIESLDGLADLYCRIEPVSWKEAHTLYCEALTICPQGYPVRAQLLSGIARCFLDAGSPFFDPVQGISHLSEAYADDFTYITRRLRTASTDMHNVEATYASVTRHMDEATRGRYNTMVLELYSQIVGILPLAANFGIDHKARLRAVVGTDRIARNAASRAVLVGRVSMAVETLEEGRGVFWTQTLHLRTTAFDRVPKDDREELQRLLRLLDGAAHGTKTSELSVAQRERELGRLRHLNEQAQSLMAKIRGYPGLNRFLLPSAFDAVFASLPDGFVVIVNASEVAHHALVLHRSTGLATSLDLDLPRARFESAALKAKLPRDATTLHEQHRDSSRAMRKDKGVRDSFDYVLGLLWTSIVKPVIDKLGLEVSLLLLLRTQLKLTLNDFQRSTERSRPRLWWCVTGELSFLPIHAAGKYQGSDVVCTADYVVSSYIPTLHSLIKARTNWDPMPRNELAGLIICEDSPKSSAAHYLPEAAKEVRIVRECFESVHAQVLNTVSTRTLRAELLPLLENTSAHILHLACHGGVIDEPVKS
jgi:tetratricopeptide (TPR) repeat protein